MRTRTTHRLVLALTLHLGGACFAATHFSCEEWLIVASTPSQAFGVVDANRLLTKILDFHPGTGARAMSNGDRLWNATTFVANAPLDPARRAQFYQILLEKISTDDPSMWKFSSYSYEGTLYVKRSFMRWISRDGRVFCGKKPPEEAFNTDFPSFFDQVTWDEVYPDPALAPIPAANAPPSAN